MLHKLIRLLIRRKLFKGQFRLFMWLNNKNFLEKLRTIDSPIMGSFKLHLNTKNFLDSSIYYTGDYEQYLKINFKNHINPEDTVFDVGANIGFHTLFFSELVGKNGRVYAFEPIENNYKALIENLNLNQTQNVEIIKKALGNVNQVMQIHIDKNSTNPGAFSLLEEGDLNTEIGCIKGDDFCIEHNINQVNFLKIDVEGFEIEVLKGLEQSIKKFHPKIIFEYDKNYQQKINDDPTRILHFLQNLAYEFYEIDGYGKTHPITNLNAIKHTEILALPIK